MNTSGKPEKLKVRSVKFERKNARVVLPTNCSYIRRRSSAERSTKENRIRQPIFTFRTSHFTLFPGEVGFCLICSSAAYKLKLILTGIDDGKRV